MVLEWDRLSGLPWMGMDVATAFLPWYTLLGQQLRQGHVPVWNPYQFSGTPFAADPESGWMYLPAMLAFALLPADAAMKAHLLFNSLLASLSTYGLARALGASPLGGIAAATVYAHSGFFEGHNVCCYAYADVAAWLPLALLAARRATTAKRLRTRTLLWAVAGLAVSQIIAAWIGQGAYYALLVLAGFVIVSNLRALRRLAVEGLGILAFSLGLGAAGVLPRVEYNLVSNLPGGYPTADVSLTATTWSEWGLIDGWDRLLLQPGFGYVGWPVLALALAAPVVTRRRATALYLVAFGLAVLVLARAQPTPLHAALSWLPGFERIHARSPERALIVLYLAPALLAGLTISAFGKARLRQVVSGLVICVTALDLHLAWDSQAATALAGGGDYALARVDPRAYLASTSGFEFLRAQAGAFRYLGYAGHVFGGPMPYTLRWLDPRITALGVNNRGITNGIDDVQGYNPVHVARYDEFMAALNGQGQNYHHADVFERGFDSPLLGALNVRYVVMPATLASDEVEPRFERSLTEVYRDSDVRILENPSALPRAWIVHSAAPFTFASLADPAFQPERVALLETDSPVLEAPPEGTLEQVRVGSEGVDEVDLDVTAAANGLVVVSGVFYPAWHASVDGNPAQVYAVDRALQGVAVSAGEHHLVLRYQSAALMAGLGITILTAALVAALAILHIITQSRDGSGEVRCKAGAVPQL